MSRPAAAAHINNYVKNACDSSDRALVAWPCDKLHHGGLIHILLVIAIIMILVNLISGRRL